MCSLRAFPCWKKNQSELFRQDYERMTQLFRLLQDGLHLNDRQFDCLTDILLNGCLSVVIIPIFMVHQGTYYLPVGL